VEAVIGPVALIGTRAASRTTQKQMKAQKPIIQSQQAPGFDLVRLSKSKQVVYVCPNTVRAYAKQGLNLYRRGKAVFFSKAELEAFIRSSAQDQKAIAA
jgi:hypothetical protein